MEGSVRIGSKSSLLGSEFVALEWEGAQKMLRPLRSQGGCGVIS